MSSSYCSTKYWLSDASSYRALFLFLMVLKVHLAKVVVAVVAMPTRKGVTDYTLANRFVVVVVFSLFCRGYFLLSWLCLHIYHMPQRAREIVRKCIYYRPSKIITVPVPAPRDKTLIEVTVVGPDRKGVVDNITNFIFKSGGNIEKINQNVLRGLFGMQFEASFAEEIGREQLDLGLKQLAKR